MPLKTLKIDLALVGSRIVVLAMGIQVIDDLTTHDDFLMAAQAATGTFLFPGRGGLSHDFAPPAQCSSLATVSMSTTGCTSNGVTEMQPSPNNR
jgi:hypothetical protein